MRRLRNGKVRIKGTVQVHDASEALGSSVQPLKPVSPPKKAQAGGGKVKAVKTKPPTPPLSDRNAGAVSAGPENVDELNGLDLESLNLTDKEIPARQLEKLSRIGSGGFKDVFVGIWKVGKRRNKVAIADIREKLTEMDIKELGLLRDLKHENIVRFIGVSIPEDTAKTGIPCMIVSELCSNGDLWDYVRNVKPPPDLQIFRMLLETAKGLEYLHMHSIVHRDVKSSNVLVTRERSCKINDFGLARVKTSQRSKMKSVVGTINWQAVELWCRQPQYNEKVDVWSAAMTFWETLQWYEDYKSYPFEGMNDFVIYEEVGKEGKRPPTDKIAAQFGEEIVKLLNRMWDTDPRKRPTMDMVCKDLERLIEVKEMEMDQ
ncbi:kinase-like protein [Microstroma glucosiphilum]|uniref:Kinase-like protein n=1 Tax=Pseudomicrostroma glucosiphilum TaxID=1684307 RepID=A0A316UFQ8_9BASI|nr:kinase-like protein [Pseudomicrostroma glucosiphilum]PWN23734.1 kinase-like protein [Pseudomicrostroma glucosiphilum]